ncbi:hypothetical protein EON81_12835 [bacterium]|nr:MAG: hypothetical protein EON81_12835 [bacterium]
MLAPLVIEIGLPPKGVAQNCHVHQRTRSKVGKQFKADVAKRADVARKLAKHPGFATAIVSTVWLMGATPLQPGRYRPLDEDNARGALKYAVDGLVEAGIIPADDYRTLRQGDCILVREKKHHGGKAMVLVVLVDRSAPVCGTPETSVVCTAAGCTVVPLPGEWDQVLGKGAAKAGVLVDPDLILATGCLVVGKIGSLNAAREQLGMRPYKETK